MIRDIHSLAFEFCCRNSLITGNLWTIHFCATLSQSPTPSLCHQVLTTSKSVEWEKDKKVCCLHCSLPNKRACIALLTFAQHYVSCLSASCFYHGPISFLPFLDKRITNAVKTLMCYVRLDEIRDGYKRPAELFMQDLKVSGCKQLCFAFRSMVAVILYLYRPFQKKPDPKM